MTITLDPRRIDRAPTARKHEGPYYPVDKMRRILAPEVTDPSWIERMNEWWLTLSIVEARFYVVAILLAVFCAAVIVIL